MENNLCFSQVMYNFSSEMEKEEKIKESADFNNFVNSGIQKAFAICAHLG